MSSTQLDYARNQAESLAEKVESLRGRTDPDSLRTVARCLLGVSYSADLLEKHGPKPERSHWHHVGTAAEKRIAEVATRLSRRGRNHRQSTLKIIHGGRG